VFVYKQQSLKEIQNPQRTYLIFFDNLDRISPSQQAFIETLLNIAVICAAVVEMKGKLLLQTYLGFIL